jgi:hypothetical protein
MQNHTQGFKAGRIYPVDFDCVLPPSARAEFFGSWRQERGRGTNGLPARHVSQQPPPVDRSREYSKLISGGLGLVAAIAALAIMIGGLKHPSGEPVRLPAPAPVVQAPTPAAPAPVPFSRAPEPAAPRGEEQAPVVPLVPTPVPVPREEVRRAEPVTKRAELVKLPPPRAQLAAVRLGGQYLMVLPDGRRIYAVFRGAVDQLPLAGVPGDMVLVNGGPWVWDGKCGLIPDGS